MEKLTPELRPYPNRIELAACFVQDAKDYYAAYRLIFFSTENDFQSIKSRRMKCFIELRMALETLLKSLVALRSSYDLAGNDLYQKLRKHSHNISSLLDEVVEGLAIDEALISDLKRCDEVRVKNRYEFEARQIRALEDDYYATVGDDSWLCKIENFIETGINRVSTFLDRRSKVVSASVLFDEQANRRFDFQA